MRGEAGGILASVQFETVELLVDSRPRGAALNMALDEVLLSQAKRPLLRVYEWARPAVSYGYFEPWEPVAVAYPGRERVRRWTGGGVVPHGEDWTYSLIVPRSDAMAKVRPAETYRWVHQALAGVLQDWDGCEGISYGLGGAGGMNSLSGITVATETAQKASQACFENPVAYDILIGGRKIAGAAQRRSRFGLLHQGSVQGVPVPGDFAGRLAYALAGECLPGIIHDDTLALAEVLAAEKYATETWGDRV